MIAILAGAIFGSRARAALPDVQLLGVYADPSAAGEMQSMHLRLGPMIAIDWNANPRRLYVRFKFNQRAVRGADGAWTLPDIPLASMSAVYRNGLRQAPGGDFTLSGAKITFRAATEGDDIVLADYAY